MLKTLSIRTGLLSLLAVMTLLLLIVSGIGIYALTQSSSSLQRINHLQGEQMVQLNSGYTLILRARNEAGQAVRMMEIGMLDDAASAVKNINQEVALAQKTLKGVIDGGVADEQGQQLLDKVAASLAAYNQQGINPMLKTLNDQSADGYYDLLEKTLIPLASAFDNDMQAFQKWSEARGQAEVSAVQASKTRVLILIILAALLTAGIIVLAWLALRHMLLKPLSASIAQLENVAAGDLTHTLAAPASQEFNRLNAVIEEMRQSLMNSVLRVRDASAQIDTGSRELTLGNRDLAERTESTATSLEQTAVKEYIEGLAKDEKTKALVSMVLRLLARDAKGTLKASRIVQLRKVAMETGDDRFIEGVRIIEEAYQPEVSKQFIRAEIKNENGMWKPIPLGMTES